MDGWIFRMVESGGLAGVFLLMLLETVFPPIPSEVIMPVAGLAAANGPLTLGGVIVAGTAGAMTGNLIWYLVARLVGLDRFRPLIERQGFGLQSTGRTSSAPIACLEGSALSSS